MAKQSSPIDFNSFIGGIVTEASPLAFPPNSSIDESNMVLLKDGTRRRRLGMDYEAGYSTRASTQFPVAGGTVAFSSYRWRNAGGNSSVELTLFQVGLQLFIYDFSSPVLSSGYISSYTFPVGMDKLQKCSYSTVDGLVVVAIGTPEVYILEYSSPTVTVTTKTLKVRDMFGVEDVVGGVDLVSGSGITVRPSSLPDTHLYNLHNQSWAEPRRPSGAETLSDPISLFYTETSSTAYPSNSDSVVPVLYADTDNSTNRTIDRFHPQDLVDSTLGTYPAPRGYFIIDVLNRGISRGAESAALKARHPEIASVATTLPTDYTPGGATVVGQFGGRVWYAGFSGEVVDGDARSPRLSSYVLFSKLVASPEDVGVCYQDGDPTSKNSPDLIDTDGGFIKVDGAYNILALVETGSSLAVIAENGVWTIQGGDNGVFTASSYSVKKVSPHGCVGKGTITGVDSTVMYWAESGIYHLKRNQFGDPVVENISFGKIQSLYDSIPVEKKALASGVYDEYDRKIRWMYNISLADTEDVNELLLDLELGAYSKNVIGTASGQRVVEYIEVPPFNLTDIDVDVVVGGDSVVLASGDQVVVRTNQRVAGVRNTAYLTVTSQDPSISFTFSRYRDESFLDWRSNDGVGVDAPAFLLTGWVAAGDIQRNKQVSYVTFHFIRTEDGFTADANGDLTPNNQSGCKVQAQWEWANSANSGRWGNEFQAYRYRRAYMPSGASDPYDTGFKTVVTKSKLRGKGKALSLLIKTEPGKDLKLLGWSYMATGNSNV